MVVLRTRTPNGIVRPSRRQTHVTDVVVLGLLRAAAVIVRGHARTGSVSRFAPRAAGDNRSCFVCALRRALPPALAARRLRLGDSLYLAPQRPAEPGASGHFANRFANRLAATGRHGPSQWPAQEGRFTLSVAPDGTHRYAARRLPKQNVAGSSPVSRSKPTLRAQFWPPSPGRGKHLRQRRLPSRDGHLAGEATEHALARDPAADADPAARAARRSRGARW